MPKKMKDHKCFDLKNYVEKPKRLTKKDIKAIPSPGFVINFWDEGSGDGDGEWFDTLKELNEKLEYYYHNNIIRYLNIKETRLSYIYIDRMGHIKDYDEYECDQSTNRWGKDIIFFIKLCLYRKLGCCDMFDLILKTKWDNVISITDGLKQKYTNILEGARGGFELFDTQENPYLRFFYPDTDTDSD